MKIRQKIAAAMMIPGMLICVGATGNTDYGTPQTIGKDELVRETIKAIIGPALMGAVIPVSVDCREEIDEESEVEDDENSDSV